MEKNQFLLFNDIVYEMNKSQNKDELKTQFLERLKLLIPYHYASIIFSHQDTLFDKQPICVPEYFIQAEKEYIDHCQEDELLWAIHSHESTILIESDLLPENKRLQSSLYKNCYQKYNIYDQLQYTIVYNQQFLGVLTLYRTRSDGLFNDDDLFYLRSLGKHLNLLVYQLEHSQRIIDIKSAQAKFHLTVREIEIIKNMVALKTNSEIARDLHISEYTIAKHIQNIFKKMNIASRIELLRLFMDKNN
ncbi:MAG: response regulator transcription factor [Faecalibacillus sp.]